MEETNTANVAGVTVYSKDGCKYCTKSKTLLTDNKIPFTEIKMDPDHESYQDERSILLDKTNGHTTFPFIFIGTEFLGGYTELNHSFNTNISEKLKSVGIEYTMDLDF
jgi:glutaredoxin 3